MKFNNHKNLAGLHAPFTASQSSWLRYDDDKVIEVYANRKAAEMGTRLHNWAAETIELGLKQPKSKKTICAYVNDAIGFNMSTEVVLFYSDRFFGTADAIVFNGKTLRIHDLRPVRWVRSNPIESSWKYTRPSSAWNIESSPDKSRLN